MLGTGTMGKNGRVHVKMGIQFVIIAIVTAIILAGVIVFSISCKTPSTPNPPGQPTAPSQTPTPSQNPPATISNTPPTTQPTTTASPVPSPTQVTPPSPSPTPPASSNIIINHSNWDWYNSQPAEISGAVANLKIFFAHASVGANILKGMDDLHSADSSKYPLIQKSSGGTPPATTVNGAIYEFSRGNPGWTVKISDFETYIKNGWHDTKVDLAMNKFCYVDPKADWTVYRDSMVALEAKYPGTRFVYWTMPLTTDKDSNEVLRAQFNQNLRDWIAGQSNKLFFDLADIEAWSPDGQQQLFTSQGQNYPRVFAGYTPDGGHLNQDAAKRVATGLYSLFGKISQAK
jgi:hypothetical protein